MRPLKFILPCNIESFSFSKLDKKVVVVSVFGKSRFIGKACKTGMLSSILEVDLLDKPTIVKETLSEIEGYYDHKEQVVYLHLKGLLDTYHLVKEYDDFIEKQEQKDFLSAWAHMNNQYARALLVLFHISHVLILSHPTPNFDYSYINLFKALDTIRQKVSTHLSTVLGSISGLPKSWISNGRPCSPRMLFYFETCPSIFRDPESGSTIKKLEHSLEDRIYQVLRKNRIVTNISGNSLFAIPANQEFVFINTDGNEMQDIISYMTKELIKSCIDPSNLKNLKSTNGAISSECETVAHKFTEFLQQHVNLAFSKGFDDNVGRHAVSAHFEIPTLSTLFDISNKLYKFFVKNPDKDILNLHALLDTDVKFSKNRCSKVLPRAFQAYQENLPQHYTREYHETKLAHAMVVFEMHARGPLFEEYSEKLQEECEKHWRTGRQMCQVLSLTGNPCTNPIHIGGGEGGGGGEPLESRDDFKDLQTMEHCSGVRYVCACNCGRCQGSREDPFSLKQANYDYFQMLAIQCGCNKLETFQFPVFQPSTHNFRPAQLQSSLSRKDSIGRSDFYISQNQTQLCSLGVNEEITTYESGCQSQPQVPSDPAEEKVSSKSSFTPSDDNRVILTLNEHDSGNQKEKPLARQASTTEYNPSMLNTESPPGLLPQFSSWSLICLGSSSIYSHNIGLQHQSGLYANSAFLLPWDVLVKLEHQKEKGSIWSNEKGKSFQNANALRGRKSKRGKELLVKIFVGVEYECPRGHRFMASSPDTVLKASGMGTVKDNGNKVTSSDMPLYFACPCRQTKPLIAQLMRIHIVTPKAPVHVTLNPRIQPGLLPCPVFVTGCEEPIKLSQSAYWILRLPYVYVGEKGPYLSPKDPVPITHGKLLAGMYGITEALPEKK